MFRARGSYKNKARYLVLTLLGTHLDLESAVDF